MAQAQWKGWIVERLGRGRYYEDKDALGIELHTDDGEQRLLLFPLSRLEGAITLLTAGLDFIVRHHESQGRRGSVQPEDRPRTTPLQAYRVHCDDAGALELEFRAEDGKMLIVSTARQQLESLQSEISQVLQESAARKLPKQ